jgi:hypothetical protein
MSEPGRDDPGKERRRGVWSRLLMKVFGPADLGPEHRHNPLKGTKYDPAVRRGRWARRKGRGSGN